MKVNVKEEKYSKKPPISLADRNHHIINLHYPLVFQNMLPFPIEVTENMSCTEKRQLRPGEMTRYSHTTIINDSRFLTTVSDVLYIIYSILMYKPALVLFL